MNKTKQTGPSCQILHRNAQKENLSAQNRDSPIDFPCLVLAKRDRCEINDGVLFFIVVAVILCLQQRIGEAVESSSQGLVQNSF